MRRLLLILALTLAAIPASAQFRGPSATGNSTTVALARDIPVGDSAVVTGRILEHVRGDTYTFADNTGRIRVEIGSGLWRNRIVTPETRLRLTTTVRVASLGRFLEVRSLDVLP